MRFNRPSQSFLLGAGQPHLIRDHPETGGSVDLVGEPGEVFIAGVSAKPSHLSTHLEETHHDPIAFIAIDFQPDGIAYLNAAAISSRGIQSPE